MCIFCAAIPAAASLGAAATVQQNEKRRDALANGQTAPRVILPAGKTTAVIVVGLIAGSVVYHTVIFPRLGV